MTRVACITMQRDEEDLLHPWLAYHGHLFGFENLHVFDNGSTSSLVRDTLRRYRAVGVNVDTSYAETRDYERKHEVMLRTINRLRDEQGCELFFPMDCDEFVVAFGDTGLSCSRADIARCLNSLPADSQVLRIRSLLLNVPGLPDAYYFGDQHKVVFRDGHVTELEHGNHHGMVEPPRQAVNVPLTYLHLHNKPFASVKAAARRKLQHRVDVDDLDAVLAYTGHGDHLTPYFRQTEAEYVNSFASLDLVDFPDFRRLVDVLGAGAGLARLSGCEVDEIPRTGNRFSSRIDAAAYFQANPDVERANLPALMHWYKHGHRENRRLRK